ncbi:hypothetical protein L288_16595 [Sphingobium quisquiliarum P25]|uniref:Uncharacterized protein n=1 Tax=Sphingobium quisquiliarum P25 TaxID=1329909 RepID=T0GNS3_9SPHN|nr:MULTISPECIES: hypothetical protein [Sphingobium]EQB02312.1 hypothetical protein L288_16595 [Sphingobium quisquiliarum P25]EZP72523.1 putative uncharacterized protein precursor [Sphingomonas paucimobilis]
MSVTLIAMAAAAATHNVQIDHGGKPVQVTYSARTEYVTKTVGAKTPNRMSTQRCQWTAKVMVDRSLNQGPALARTVSSDKRYSGSEHGACIGGSRAAERHMAQHQAEIRDHVIAVAERDRGPLLAELDAVRNLASN